MFDRSSVGNKTKILKKTCAISLLNSSLASALFSYVNGSVLAGDVHINGQNIGERHPRRETQLFRATHVDSRRPNDLL